MRTRDFSFGASVLEYELPEQLCTVLERWAGEFSTDSFTEDVSSKGVRHGRSVTTLSFSTRTFW